MIPVIFKIVKQKPPCDCCGEAPKPDLLAIKVEEVEVYSDGREAVVPLPFERAIKLHAALEKVLFPPIQTTGPEL